MANMYTAIKINVQKIIRLYESGMTQTEVAKEMGTTQKVIHNRLKKAGYKCRVAAKRNQSGPANHMWKGDRATYKAFHYRVTNARGRPSQCAMCDTTVAGKYEWANITGKYERLTDYIRLCVRCHRRLDYPQRLER